MVCHDQLATLGLVFICSAFFRCNIVVTNNGYSALSYVLYGSVFLRILHSHRNLVFHTSDRYQVSLDAIFFLVYEKLKNATNIMQHELQNSNLFKSMIKALLFLFQHHNTIFTPTIQ